MPQLRTRCRQPPSCIPPPRSSHDAPAELTACACSRGTELIYNCTCTQDARVEHPRAILNSTRCRDTLTALTLHEVCDVGLPAELQHLRKMRFSTCEGLKDLDSMRMTPQLRQLEVVGCMQLVEVSAACLASELRSVL